jgi:hypothetical protein
MLLCPKAALSLGCQAISISMECAAGHVLPQRQQLNSAEPTTEPCEQFEKQGNTLKLTLRHPVRMRSARGCLGLSALNSNSNTPTFQKPHTFFVHSTSSATRRP